MFACAPAPAGVAAGVIQGTSPRAEPCEADRNEEDEKTKYITNVKIFAVVKSRERVRNDPI